LATQNTTSGDCPYVSLKDYDWAIVPFLTDTRGACHGISLPWNPTVICLFAALHGVAAWIALFIPIQAVLTFKRWSTVYFW
jgi:hypothetical protein